MNINRQVKTVRKYPAAVSALSKKIVIQKIDVIEAFKVGHTSLPQGTGSTITSVVSASSVNIVITKPIKFAKVKDQVMHHYKQKICNLVGGQFEDQFQALARLVIPGFYKPQGNTNTSDGGSDGHKEHEDGSRTHFQCKASYSPFKKKSSYANMFYDEFENKILVNHNTEEHPVRAYIGVYNNKDIPRDKFSIFDHSFVNELSFKYPKVSFGIMFNEDLFSAFSRIIPFEQIKQLGWAPEDYLKIDNEGNIDPLKWKDAK